MVCSQFRLDKKTILFMLAIFIVGGFVYLFSRTPEADPSGGWETLEVADRPFKPGAITNGRPPSNVEISIIEPKSSTSIRTPPEGLCQFLVKVKANHGDSSADNHPPTFAFIKIFKKGARYSGGIPSQRFEIAKVGNISGSLSSSSKSSKSGKRDDMPLDVAVLKPSAIGVSGFDYVYSGVIRAPKKAGDYSVVIEVEYVIVHNNNKGTKSNPPTNFRASIRGATLHVET